MVELIRIPSESYQRQREPDAFYLVKLRHKYEYATPDGRWLIRETCGHRWSVIDTTGEITCASHSRHATDVKTLAAAKAFIAEWTP